MLRLTREKNLKKEEYPEWDLRVEALDGVTPLTIFIINPTATSENKLNKKDVSFY